MILREEHIKKILVWVILLLLFVPWVQGRLHFKKERELKGAIEKSYNPILDEKSWIEGRFQKFKEDYLNAQFGFRPFFIRLNNQLEYFLFKTFHAKYVILGKENYLYEYNYIKANIGRDFIGEEAITKHLLQLKKIQDSLAQNNKTFIFVMAASKGQYYSEYFPDSCIYPKSKTNYEVYASKAKELGINFMDLNAYFLANKNTTQHPFYSKYGIHWTYYGACIAADSIIHYIEKKRNIDMPELYWDSIVKEPARNDDRDIELGLNLLLPFKPEILSYPVLKYGDVKGKQLPSVMVIADSYYWSLFNLSIFHSFSKNQFWYYYSQIYEAGKEGIVQANDALLKKSLRDFDVVILLGTDANLYNLGWEFIERAEKILDSNSYMSLDFQEKVDHLKAYIPKDSAWIKDIRIKALKNGISVDSMVTMDAIWMVGQERMKNEK